MVDLAYVADVVVEVRCDELVEVRDLGRFAAFGGDVQWSAESLRDADRAVSTLVWAHAAEKEESISWLPVDPVARHVDRIRDVRDPWKVR